MSRLPRVEQTIQEIVAVILQQELKDPRIGLVTVTRVKVSADLQHALVYFSFLGQGEPAVIEAGLKSAAPYVRKLLGERLRMRYTPELKFLYDPSVEEGIRLQRLMDQTKRSSHESAEGH